jgi:hypothetical protein
MSSQKWNLLSLCYYISSSLLSQKFLLEEKNVLSNLISRHSLLDMFY